MLKPVIQVAGVADLAEARLLLEAGVDLLGFPFGLECNEEDLELPRAAEIVGELGIGERSVLITYLREAGEIHELARELGCGWVQLHGDLRPGQAGALRRLAPGLKLVKSLVLGDPAAPDPEVLQDAFMEHVDAFISDSYDPLSGARGATGMTHDWELSRRLAARGGRPLILAGGLKPGNVARAIRRVRPAGVDAHTGLEDGRGRKDPRVVAEFVREARAAFQLHAPAMWRKV